jgi:hypothetical protein
VHEPGDQIKGHVRRVATKRQALPVKSECKTCQAILLPVLHPEIQKPDTFLHPENPTIQ